MVETNFEDSLQYHRDWEDGYRDGILFHDDDEVNAIDQTRYNGNNGYTAGFDQAAFDIKYTAGLDTKKT